MESGALIELHAHILPQMDDGSESVEMSLAMLQALAEMGVGTVCATSHYYARENSITMYLARRAAALNALHSAIPAGNSLPASFRRRKQPISGGWKNITRSGSASRTPAP